MIPTSKGLYHLYFLNDLGNDVYSATSFNSSKLNLSNMYKPPVYSCIKINIFNINIIIFIIKFISFYPSYYNYNKLNYLSEKHEIVVKRSS
jgi:hypothetical protein